MLFIPDKGDSFQKSYFREVVKKNGLFTVRLTVRGGGHNEAILELFK